MAMMARVSASAATESQPWAPNIENIFPDDQAHTSCTALACRQAGWLAGQTTHILTWAEAVPSDTA